MVKNTTTQNTELLLSKAPNFMSEYVLFHNDSLDNIPTPFYRRLVEIDKFLKFYAREKHTAYVELTLKDLEDLPLDIIQLYIKNSHLKASSMKFMLSTLSVFWNYFTIYSFSLERGKPLFYRHAINEWKVAYSDTYEAIKNNSELISNKPKKEYLNLKEAKKLLDFIDNSFVLTLSTQKKVDNWEKNKERNLAIIALLIGSGISVEEMARLNITDINMKKGEVVISRNNHKHTIKLLDFTIPYITNYVKYRRKWWVVGKNEAALFLNQQKKRGSTNLFTTVIQLINKSCSQTISATMLRASHAHIVYEKTHDLSAVKDIQGFKNLNALEKIL